LQPQRTRNASAKGRGYDATVTTRMREWLAGFDLPSRAAALSVASNALLMALKLSFGLIFGSVALLGDGIDSAEDVLASALAFFTVRLALQPADEEHPYGHGKAESLAALSQAGLIGGGAVFIAVAAVLRLLQDDAEIHVVPSLVATVITAAVNLGVAAYAFRAGRISGSVAIQSDARHLLTNVVQAAAVGLALVLVGITGNHIFDPLLALLLAAYLAWTSLTILRVALRELIDTSLPPETVAAIEACLAHEEHHMRGYHALRTRKSGREVHIDVHVLVDPELSVSDAHRLVEHLDADLRSTIDGAIVNVHIDPDEPGIMERMPEQRPVAADAGVHLHRR
jgi:cation diffusion facilitator family transporter